MYNEMCVQMPFYYSVFNMSLLRSRMVSVTWAYISRVVATFLCPRRSCTYLTSAPLASKLEACVCHYGIITTNGKSLDFQGVSAFVAVYSIPFPKLKYGEKIDEKRRLLH